MAKLTLKQQTFVDALMLDPEQNQTKAYQKVYPNSSLKAAESGAARLLRNAKVAAYLNEQKKARSERTEIDADWLLKRFAKEVDADLADLYDEVTGALKPMHQWPSIWRQGLVTGVEVQQQFAYVDGDKVPDGVITKIKISDRVKRLELMGKHIAVSAFEERVKHGVTDELGDLLKQIAPKTLDPNRNG